MQEHVSSSPLPQPEFHVGQTVWEAITVVDRGRWTCPDCAGQRTWKATSAVGEVFNIQCPRCEGSYLIGGQLRSIPTLDRQVHITSVRAMTIGSIRMDTNSDPVFDYMCKETGIGTGSIYKAGTSIRRRGLYATEEAATEAAESLKQLEQESTDGAPTALKVKELSVLPLKTALKMEWQRSLYDSWAKARDYREVIDGLFEMDRKDERGFDEILEELKYTTEDKPWRPVHPIDALIEAARVACYQDNKVALLAAIEAVVEVSEEKTND